MAGARGACHRDTRAEGAATCPVRRSRDRQRASIPAAARPPLRARAASARGRPSPRNPTTGCPQAQHRGVRSGPVLSYGPAVTALSLERIHTVAVIGAGTMGHGIAHVVASTGARVHLYDAIAGAA